MKFGLMIKLILKSTVFWFFFWGGGQVRLVSAILNNNLIVSYHATRKCVCCIRHLLRHPVVTDVLLTAVAACYVCGTSLFGRQFKHWKDSML